MGKDEDWDVDKAPKDFTEDEADQYNKGMKEVAEEMGEKFPRN